jgi:hypothetical protein
MEINEDIEKTNLEKRAAGRPTVLFLLPGKRA